MWTTVIAIGGLAAACALWVTLQTIAHKSDPDGAIFDGSCGGCGSLRCGGPTCKRSEPAAGEEGPPGRQGEDG